MSKFKSPWLIETTEVPGMPWQPVTSSDINGDGVLDVMLPVGWLDPEFGDHVMYGIMYGKGRSAGLLKRVTDGLGNFVEVEYGTSDGTYMKGINHTNERELGLKRLNSLVKHHVEGYRVGGARQVERTYDYTYTDGRVDRRGHGWLGFAKRTITERDGSGKLRSSLEVRYDKRSERFRTNPTTEPVETYVYPFAGVATGYTLYSGLAQSDIVEAGAAIRATVVEMDWRVKQSSVGERPFPYMAGRVTQVHENGVLLTATYESFDVDGFGNQTEYRALATHSVATTTVFDPGPARIDNWLISLPRSRTVISTRDGVSATRRMSFQHDDTTGLLLRVVREPDNPALRQTTTFTYNSFGNVSVASVSADGAAPERGHVV